jgi:hypothetical protein
VPPAPCDPALRSEVNEIQRGLLHGQVRLHADKHTVQNIAMTITTALEEAVSRMQLQLHSLPVKRWRKRKSAGGNRRLQDAKKHARQILLEEVAGGGLANSRYRGAFSIFPKKTPNFGVFAKNLSKVRLRKLSLFSSPVSPSWAERDLIPLLFSWYKTYR